MRTIINSLKTASPKDDTFTEIILATCAVIALLVNGNYFFN